MNDDLFEFQKKVFGALQEGHNVILQAPTGSGKTRAALYPFLYYLAEPDPRAFPRRCIYSAPMRVLVNQFGAEYKEIVSRYKRLYGLDLRYGVTVQTGERPEDRLFEGDLVFTTIDQTLSNVLGVPYAVGQRRANINAGAVIGSYLVFDEFHLFPPEGALKTTLQLLRWLRSVSPFVVMTATFSAEMVKELASLLGAKGIIVEPEELAHIPSQQSKERRFHVVKGMLTADAVLASHADRSIVICNTVERAQKLYLDLKERGCQPLPVDDPCLDDLYMAIERAQKSSEREEALLKALERLYERVCERSGWEQNNWVVLLHARFTREHRDVKEEFIRREFGATTKYTRRIPRIILVATQVVEVGLDITCEALHSEIAPAASIIQRAGRCARFAGEKGDVYVYDAPPDKNGAPNYAPYLGDEASLCRKTWKVFQERDDGAGFILGFSGEQEVINAVHSEADRRLLDEVRVEERQIWEEIALGMAQGDPSVRPRLIRRVDSRVLLVHDDPQQLGNPFACRGFSVWHGTLRGKLDQLLEWADELELEWALQRPVEEDREDEEESPSPVRVGWMPVSSDAHLSLSPLFVIHPALVAYDAELGFRFGISDGRYRTNPAPWSDVEEKENYTYQLESYTEHVREMMGVYHQQLREPMAYAAARLESQLGVPEGSVERAIRLAIALHDVGKLQSRWQKWARVYQEAIGEGVPPFLVAHTHWDPERHPYHRQARDLADRRVRKPNHAAEGAVAAARLVHQAVDGHEGLRRAVLTAIARHHSPYTRGFDEKYRLDPGAPATVAEALEAAGLSPGKELASLLLSDAPSTQLEQIILQPTLNEWWLLYFLIVRALRLADKGS